MRFCDRLNPLMNAFAVVAIAPPPAKAGRALPTRPPRASVSVLVVPPSKEGVGLLPRSGGGGASLLPPPLDGGAGGAGGCTPNSLYKVPTLPTGAPAPAPPPMPLRLRYSV